MTDQMDWSEVVVGPVEPGVRAPLDSEDGRGIDVDAACDR